MIDVHVALITPWRRQGGIATYSSNFVDALEDAGAECTIVPIENPPSANPLEFIDLVDEIPDSADVVHVQFEAGLFGQLLMTGVGAPAFFLALGRLDNPVVTTLHEVHREHPHRGRLGDWLLRWRDFVIERLVLRVSDATIVHTVEARNVLQERHGDKHRIERMLHPANSDADLIPKERAKNELNIAGPMLLTFGFVEEKKRYRDLIRILPDLSDGTYVIAGGYREGEGREHADECRKLAKELGVEKRVRFTGYVEDEQVPIMFSAADVVILPYRRVSQSGVVNDALEYRRPIVASALPAFKELREEFECLVTYNSESELAEAVKTTLYDDSAREQLTNAAKVYIDEVNWNAFAVQTHRLYSEIGAPKCSSSEVTGP